MKLAIGVLGQSTFLWLAKVGLVACDDGVRWSVVRYPPGAVRDSILLPEHLMGMRRVAFSGVSESWLRSDQKALLKWAMKQPASATIEKPPQKNVRAVLIDGCAVSMVVKRRAEDIEKVLERCMGLMRAQWGWTPDILWVEELTMEPMGLAYSPGSGTKYGRRIALSKRLLENYDNFSLERVILHEICHHYRDEVFEKNKALDEITGGHDPVFCRELQKVDPLSTGTACRNFEADVSITLAKQAAATKYPKAVWSLDAGVLDGTDKGLAWLPKPPFRWKVERLPFREETVLFFLQKFPRAEWHKVKLTRVFYADRGAMKLDSLASLAVWASGRNQEVKAFVDSQESR